MSPKPQDRVQLVWVYDDADMRGATYLAVDSSRTVKKNQIKDYGYKRSQASEGVNLPKLPFSKRLHVEWENQEKALRYGPISSTGRGDSPL